jgi:predicted porin
MKKHLVALCATAAAGLPAAAQQSTSSVTLYGITDIAVAHVSNLGGAGVNLVDSGRLQSSRFGFRGREDLGDGLAALFTLENGFALDTGAQTSASTFWNRQAYVGLSSPSAGTITLGFQYTPIYDQLILLSPNVTFGGHAGAVDGVATPTSAPGRYNNTLGGTRTANSVKYTSPRFAGFRAIGMIGLGEVAGSSSAGRQASVALGYDQGPLSAGIGYLTTNCSGSSGCAAGQARDEVLVAGAGYDFKVARVSAILSQQKNARNVVGNEATSYSVLGTVPIGDWALSAGYSAMNDKSARDWDLHQVNAGVQYYLSKRTTLYGFWSRQKVDNGGKAHMLLLESGDSRQAQYGIGLRHIF